MFGVFSPCVLSNSFIFQVVLNHWRHSRDWVKREPWEHRAVTALLSKGKLILLARNNFLDLTATKPCLHTGDSCSWEAIWSLSCAAPQVLLSTWDALCRLHSPGSSNRRLAPLRTESCLLLLFQRLRSSGQAFLPTEVKPFLHLHNSLWKQ